MFFPIIVKIRNQSFGVISYIKLQLSCLIQRWFFLNLWKININQIIIKTFQEKWLLNINYKVLSSFNLFEIKYIINLNVHLI